MCKGGPDATYQWTVSLHKVVTPDYGGHPLPFRVPKEAFEKETLPFAHGWLTLVG